jgi:hypothetical protein
MKHADRLAERGSGMKFDTAIGFHDAVRLSILLVTGQGDSGEKQKDTRSKDSHEENTSNQDYTEEGVEGLEKN